MWGGSVEVAYVFQAVVAIFAASAVVWVWQSSRPFALKAAAVAVGSLMVSPYVLQYDLVLLALPIAWLAMEGFEKGFLPYEKAVLSVAWILPRVSLPLSQSAKIPACADCNHRTDDGDPPARQPSRARRIGPARAWVFGLSVQLGA